MKLFLSYARVDQTEAERLERDLEVLGYHVWRDDALTGGQPWWDRILEEIEGCDAFVFALSTASLNSDACRREYRYARALGIQILPVMVGEGVETAALPEPLILNQIVSYVTPDHVASLKLAKAVQNLEPPAPRPTPLPPRPDPPIPKFAKLQTEVRAEGEIPAERQMQIAVELTEAMTEQQASGKAFDLAQELMARDETRTGTRRILELGMAAAQGIRETHPSAAVRPVPEPRPSRPSTKTPIVVRLTRKTAMGYFAILVIIFAVLAYTSNLTPPNSLTLLGVRIDNQLLAYPFMPFLGISLAYLISRAQTSISDAVSERFNVYFFWVVFFVGGIGLLGFGVGVLDFISIERTTMLENASMFLGMILLPFALAWLALVWFFAWCFDS